MNPSLSKVQQSLQSLIHRASRAISESSSWILSLTPGGILLPARSSNGYLGSALNNDPVEFVARNENRTRCAASDSTTEGENDAFERIGFCLVGEPLTGEGGACSCWFDCSPIAGGGGKRAMYRS